MNEFVRRVYEDGKITIPKEIRDLQEIEAGDYVRVRVDVVRKNSGVEQDASEENTTSTTRAS